MKTFLAAIAAMALFAAPFASAEVQEKTAKIGNTTVHYKVVLPKLYDPAKAYPAVLAFPGGAQSMDMVDRSIQSNWEKEAEARGYIVISPAAPDGALFFEGGERIFPAFLTKLLADYKIQGNKFDMAGVSNGGISAFHVAALHPQYFKSITGFPGYLPDENAASMKAISNMCINMYVGEQDTGWREDMQKQADQFRKMGMHVKFSVEKGQGHIMRTLAGEGAARLFAGFDEARNGGCSH
jgi:poly(3-hydroxybutyrate) depolymerase